MHPPDNASQPSETDNPKPVAPVLSYRSANDQRPPSPFRILAGALVVLLFVPTVFLLLWVGTAIITGAPTASADSLVMLCLLALLLSCLLWGMFRLTKRLFSTQPARKDNAS
jgi:protein-S-isoprenylcysteine O-methyltransferase Ste14